jgi:cytochrome c553
MNSLIVALSRKEKIKIANYYATLIGTIDNAQLRLLSLGQRIYRGGDANKGVPACLACHGPAGLGNPSAGFPRLSGQHAQYIATQLKAFRDGKRNNDKFQMMPVISKKMNDAEIIAVANYISGLYL